MIRLLLLFPLVLLLGGCGGSSTPGTDKAGSFFSLSDYFTGEAARLQQIRPLVLKTAAKGDLSATKTVRVPNWKNEFGLFIESDINKPAWKDRYRQIRQGNWVEYRSTDPSQRTSLIRVTTNAGGKPVHITVRNRASNVLYSSSEQLDYYADSLYVIRKKQQVTFLGTTAYYIRGKIISKKR